VGEPHTGNKKARQKLTLAKAPRTPSRPLSSTAQTRNHVETVETFISAQTRVLSPTAIAAARTVDQLLAKLLGSTTQHDIALLLSGHSGVRRKARLDDMFTLNTSQLKCRPQHADVHVSTSCHSASEVCDYQRAVHTFRVLIWESLREPDAVEETTIFLWPQKKCHRKVTNITILWVPRTPQELLEISRKTCLLSLVGNQTVKSGHLPS
jgi:hypothetical protein